VGGETVPVIIEKEGKRKECGKNRQLEGPEKKRGGDRKLFVKAGA